MNSLAIFINWGMNVAFWSSLTFLLGINAVWPWWKSAWGANIMSFDLAIVLALLPVTLSRDFGWHFTTSIEAAWTEAVALWLVGIIVIWRGGLIITEQVKATKRHRNEDDLAARRDEKTLMREEADSEKKCQS